MRFYQAIVLAGWLASSIAIADGNSEVSQGSALSATGVSMITAGSVEVIATSPALVVQAATISAEAGLVVLKSAATAATVSIEITPEIAGYLSQAVGSTVEVVAEASGYALLHAGRLIAFVPNELSRSLLHHAPHPR